MSNASKPLAAILQDLADPGLTVRRSAIRALGALGDTQAVPVLIGLLEAKETPVRIQAILALAKLSRPETIDALLGASQSDILAVRRSAVKALSRISDPRIVPALIQALTDSDAPTTAIAAQALEKQVDRRAVPGLVALVSDEKRTAPKEQWQKRDAFALARTAGIDALGSLGDPQAVPVLVAALAEDDESVQDSAVRNLVKFGCEAFPLLAAVLDDGNESTRFGVIQTLDAMHCPGAVQSIIPLLKDSAARVRAMAARYLGKCGDPAAVPALADTIEDTADEGPNALLAFGEQGREALRAILYRKPGKAHSILMSIRNLEDHDTRFVPPLIELLQSDAAESRIQAARTLAYFRDERAVLPLIDALRDRETLVRQEVVQALGQLKDTRAIDGLLSALKDNAWSVRCRAIEALALVGASAAVEPLIQKLRPEVDIRERKAAACSLGILRDVRAIEPLLAIANNPEDAIADAFPAALGNMSDRRAVPALLRILHCEDRVMRQEAAEALGRLKDPSAVTVIIAALRQRPDYSAELVLALGSLGDKAAVDPIVEALEREPNLVAFQAVEDNGGAAKPFLAFSDRVFLEEYGIAALAKLNASAELKKFLQHKNGRIRASAARALASLEEHP